MSGAHPKLVAETEFKIEKDVAIQASGSGQPLKYPFPQMEVGDSFFVPGGRIAGANSAAAAASRGYARRHNMTFRSRSVDGGVRIWRIA